MVPSLRLSRQFVASTNTTCLSYPSVPVPRWCTGGFCSPTASSSTGSTFSLVSSALPGLAFAKADNPVELWLVLDEPAPERGREVVVELVAAVAANLAALDVLHAQVLHDRLGGDVLVAALEPRARDLQRGRQYVGIASGKRIPALLDGLFHGGTRRLFPWFTIGHDRLAVASSGILYVVPTRAGLRPRRAGVEQVQLVAHDGLASDVAGRSALSSVQKSISTRSAPSNSS